LRFSHGCKFFVGLNEYFTYILDVKNNISYKKNNNFFVFPHSVTRFSLFFGYVLKSTYLHLSSIAFQHKQKCKAAFRVPCLA
jgi:hypothetical protein